MRAICSNSARFRSEGTNNRLRSFHKPAATSSANKGSDIVLFDYGTLGGGGADTFGTINFIGGFGELDYTTGGQIRLLSVVPEPSSTALLGLGGLALMLRRKRS